MTYSVENYKIKFSSICSWVKKYTTNFHNFQNMMIMKMYQSMKI